MRRQQVRTARICLRLPDRRQQKNQIQGRFDQGKLEAAGSLPDIDVVDLRCSDRATLLRVDMDLKNDSKEVRRIAYRFRWLDKEGMRAWEDESWKPLLIYGKTLQTLTTMSPSQEATDFRVVIMDQDK